MESLRRFVTLTRQPGCANTDTFDEGPGDKPFSKPLLLHDVRSTSDPFRSENPCTPPSSLRVTYHPRSPDSRDKDQRELRPPKLRIQIPCYTSHNTISPSLPAKSSRVEVPRDCSIHRGTFLSCTGSLELVSSAPNANNFFFSGFFF